MKKFLIIASLLLATQTAIGAPNDFNSSISLHQIPAAKQTPLGKYLTSTEAHKLIQEDDSIVFIDVRDPVEIGMTGHPDSIDAIVPIRIRTTEYDSLTGEFKLAQNTNFLNEMNDVLDMNNKNSNDMIIITCGSGFRSAMAVELLAANGYTNVWHIPDSHKDDNKPDVNKYNAWKLAGLPWSKELVHGSEWRLIITE